MKSVKSLEVLNMASKSEGKRIISAERAAGKKFQRNVVRCDMVFKE